tara:strand:- start:74 stop:232 length:159 start_codon:yes stop_codon:yes gene_type:complete
MPNFEKNPNAMGSPYMMKGKSPMMKKLVKAAPTKMHGKKAPMKNYKKGYYGA